MMTHEEANDLLATYALDAVIGDEHEQIETHLLECPRCRADLDAYRDVAAAMGNSVEPLPEGLWESISSHLPERSDDVRPPMPRLVFSDGTLSEPATGVRSRRSVLAVVGAFAVAAAAVAAVLGIGLVRAENRADQEQVALGQATPSALVTAFETPGHKVVNLTDSGRVKVAQFVMADGRGYLVSSKLRHLSADQTYQLWGVVNGRSISLGLLGQAPEQSTFTLAGDMQPSQLGITIEPAGGSVVPSSPMVASGLV
jgi:anti-sigma-K factor RskA